MKIDTVKNDLKMVLSMIQDGVGIMNDLYRENNLLESFGVSGDVGETMEEKEIKKWEREFNREWVCPICGEVNTKDVFIKPVLEVIDEKTVKTGVSGGIAAILASGKYESDYIPTARTSDCFETEEEFDNHMLTVHGMRIDKEMESSADEEILQKYGAHYMDMRYGKQTKDVSKNNKNICMNRQEINIKED